MERYETHFMPSTFVLQSYISLDGETTGMKYARIVQHIYFQTCFFMVEFSQGQHEVYAM